MLAQGGWEHASELYLRDLEEVCAGMNSLRDRAAFGSRRGHGEVGTWIGMPWLSHHRFAVLCTKGFPTFFSIGLRLKWSRDRFRIRVSITL